ncbi:MAG: hypothetical protein FWC45_09945 [Treponema sp.]|nr:hypothetical protein [Treponema sp.]
MQEIWIPEFFITLFLFLPLIRPFFKKLNSLDGLAWLPLPAFLFTLVLIPAYGFRPEVIPLLVYAAVLTGLAIFRHARGAAEFRVFRGSGIILALPPLVLLAAAAGIAFFFTPQKDTALSTEGVYSLAAKIPETAGGTFSEAAGEKEYSIRIYTDKNDSLPSRRPLLVLLPPALGSLAAADEVAGELRDRGFTVLSYTRQGIGWRRGFISAVFSGTDSAKANSRGRALEESRKEDLLFLLSWIAKNPQVEGKGPLSDIASRDAVFLAGYDAGGSALVLLGNSISLAGSRRNPFPGVSGSGVSGAQDAIKVRGLIAIESPLWSVYREETRAVPQPPPDKGGFQGWFNSIRYGLGRWFIDMKAKKINALGQIPELSTPLLFLISDKSRETKHREDKYLALFRTFKAARGPAFLVSADGAGPLDYSDFPVKYPLIAALFPGLQKPVSPNSDAPANTAKIITYFAATVLETQDGDTSRIKKTPLPSGIQVEYKP